MRKARQCGFVLLEAMIAVAIFAIGVLALGKSVSGCVAAQQFKLEDGLARRALENRMAEIEAGAVVIMPPGPGGSSGQADELKAPFEGMKMKQSVVVVKKKNEDEQDITGILGVTLEVSWKSGGETHAKELTFYVQSPSG